MRFLAWIIVVSWFAGCGIPDPQLATPQVWRFAEIQISVDSRLTRDGESVVCQVNDTLHLEGQFRFLYLDADFENLLTVRVQQVTKSGQVGVFDEWITVGPGDVPQLPSAVATLEEETLKFQIDVNPFEAPGTYLLEIFNHARYKNQSIHSLLIRAKNP